MNEHTFVQKDPPEATATARFAPETPYGFKTNSHGDAADTRRNQQHEMQADKLEELGNLAGGVAHDLNNLLGIILGFGELLVENLKSAPEQRRYAEHIVAATERSQLMVQQILTFDHGSPGESPAVVLRDAIAEFYDLLRATLPATTELALDDQAEDAMVLVDKTQLFQVILNLCVNGSDALADQQGTVGISIASLDRARPELSRLPGAHDKPSSSFVDTWRDNDGTLFIATGAVPPGNCVSLTVSDTGTGISNAIAGQIFEPFRTTKDTARGTGLGLAVVHRIVRECGGAILVRTISGQGTQFEIILGAAAVPA